MNKYIIEIDDDLSFDVQFLQAIGAEPNGVVRIRHIEFEKLEELNSDYINEHFGELQDEAYQRGFEDGKGAIHARCEGCQNEGAKIFELPCSTCRNAYPNKWTAKKQGDKILIGDVVKLHENGDNCIVTALNIDDDDDMCVLMTRNGGFIRAYTDLLHKTGRRFDIASILEAMG